MFPTRALIFAVCIFFSLALTPLMFNAPAGHRIQVAKVRWSAVEMAKSDDRIFEKQDDAENKFKIISPPEFTDDFDRRSQSKRDITGSASIRTASAATSIDIDQSLAIEFPIAAYEPYKWVTAVKRPPLRRAKIAVNQPRRVSNNPQTNREATNTYYKPIELPPINFTTSAY